jgi:hypothetical protein
VCFDFLYDFFSETVQQYIYVQGDSKVYIGMGHSTIQGEHKAFPWLQIFITRKLRGMRTYFFFQNVTLLKKKF